MLAQVIEDMVESGSFNGINFCLACMVNSLSAHRFQPNSASKADDRRLTPRSGDRSARNTRSRPIAASPSLTSKAEKLPPP